MTSQQSPAISNVLRHFPQVDPPLNGRAEKFYDNLIAGLEQMRR